MGNYATPAYDDGRFVEQDATGTDISKYDLVKRSGANVTQVSANDSTRAFGIAVKDESNSIVLVYIGQDPISMEGASGSTLAVGDDVYPASVNTVHGEPEAAAGAKSIGKVVEIVGSKITFIPHWSHMDAGSDAVS